MARNLELNHRVQAELTPVYESILDMRHFGKHHPYMRRVTILNSAPNFTEYEIREMVWIFGFIPQWPRYTAKVFEKEKHRHIQYTSTVKGGVDLKIDFHFSNDNADATLVTEKIDIAGNALVGSILLATMKKAHLILFDSLQKALRA